MMREIALDTETTGLSPESGHRVVEIGCVEMRGRIRTGKVFQKYINPERDMPAEVFAIHGISSEFLADKPLFADIADEFLSFIGNAPLIIHNAEFDLRFLNHELAQAGFPTIEAERATCTVKMSRQKFPGSPAKLDALCKRFNIDLSARTKHGALLDSELLADVYLELMGGRQEAMLLDADRIAEALHIADRPVVAAREFPLTPEELAAHAEFLKMVKNAMWLREEEAA